MKRSILIVCAAFLIAGCKPEGGTSDTYNTDTSTRSSSTNINAAPSSVTTNDTTITPGSSTNAPRANP
jgi:hypothetical protein